jgi:hypothetical protein
MGTRAMFAAAPMRAALYESFYLRAVCPEQPVGVWLRYTVRKPPRRAPTGSLWCTVFDARRGRPFMHKLTTDAPRAPAGGWIAIGADGAMGPGYAHGECGPARWSLRFDSSEPELRHLSPAWLYRAPLPRTKLTSPAPAASFDGTLELAGHEAIELRGWPGMVGHNWGSEHAERWIWLHALAFAGAPDAWLDIALGRVRVAGRMTPWLASGVLCLDGERRRIGGLAARATQVTESADRCTLALRGARRARLRASVEVPAASAAGWRYSDPDSERSPVRADHDVVNCSVAAVELTLTTPGDATRTLRSAHGGAYELGVRTPSGNGHGHGVPLAPFADR